MRDFEIRPVILIFFQNLFFNRQVSHENRSLRSQNLTLNFQKYPKGPKNNRKSVNYFISSHFRTFRIF